MMFPIQLRGQHTILLAPRERGPPAANHAPGVTAPFRPSQGGGTASMRLQCEFVLRHFPQAAALVLHRVGCEAFPAESRIEGGVDG